MTPQNYPLKRPAEGDSDKRFTAGLMVDLKKVLTDHGYPPLASSDHVNLELALFQFLYEKAPVR